MRLFEFNNAELNASSLKPATKYVGRGTSDIKQIMAFLQEETPEAYYSTVPIYRGIRGVPSNDILQYGDSTSVTRTSSHTANYYTIIMDHLLEDWIAFPKRSKSFICSSMVHTASGFGKVYRVFPLGNPKIGVCPTRDLWHCFPVWLGSFDDIMQRFAHLALTKVEDNLESISNLVKKLNVLWPQIVSNEVFANSFYSILTRGPFLKDKDKNLYPTNFSSFTEFLSELLDPVSNDFKLLNLSELNKNDAGGKELWFSGPAYFLAVDADKLIGEF